MDSFKISGINYIAKILAYTFDPTGKYFYAITENKVIKSRSLIILDIQKREIVKIITLQTNVETSSFHTIVFPGIIPIPEQDKVFLWDHYGSWCIDNNTFDILYGSPVDNPQAMFDAGSKQIEGKWDDEKGRIILYDMAFCMPVLSQYDNSVLEIDLRNRTSHENS